MISIFFRGARGTFGSGSPVGCIKQDILFKLAEKSFMQEADSMGEDYMERIGRIIDKGIDFLFVSVSSGFLVLLTTLTFIEVFTRYLLGFSTSQVSSWCVFFLMWLSFATIGIVLKEKKHIAMGTLGEFLTNSGRIRTVLYLHIFISLTVIIFSIAFSYLGIVNVIATKTRGYNTQIAFVPYYWVWFLALPVGTLCLLAYAIKDLVDNIGRLVNPKPGSSPQNVGQKEEK